MMADNKIPTSIRMDPVILGKIKKIAREQTRSTNNMIEHLVVQEIRRYEAEYGEISLESIPDSESPAP